MYSRITSIRALLMAKLVLARYRLERMILPYLTFSYQLCYSWAHKPFFYNCYNYPWLYICLWKCFVPLLLDISTAFIKNLCWFPKQWSRKICQMTLHIKQNFQICVGYLGNVQSSSFKLLSKLTVSLTT